MLFKAHQHNLCPLSFNALRAPMYREGWDLKKKKSLGVTKSLAVTLTNLFSQIFQSWFIWLVLCVWVRTPRASSCWLEPSVHTNLTSARCRRSPPPLEARWVGASLVLSVSPRPLIYHFQHVTYPVCASAHMMVFCYLGTRALEPGGKLKVQDLWETLLSNEA